jgi:hypothetical protein
MITWPKRLILTLSFLALIATNVLTLTNAAVNAALSGLISTALGVQTVSDALRNKVDAKKKIIKNRKVATRRFGTKVTARTKKLIRQCRFLSRCSTVHRIHLTRGHAEYEEDKEKCTGRLFHRRGSHDLAPLPMAI